MEKVKIKTLLINADLNFEHCNWKAQVLFLNQDQSLTINRKMQKEMNLDIVVFLVGKYRVVINIFSRDNNLTTSVVSLSVCSH